MVKVIGGIISSRRWRLAFLSGVLFYLIFIIRYSDHVRVKQFQSRLMRLPTTSHVDGLDLKHFRVDKSQDINDLRQQLSFAFPYDAQKPIPKRVWQIWKVDTSSSEFPSNYRTFNKKWTEQNFEYSLVPDEQLIAFLENLYGEVPLIVEAFKMMPMKILKADFLRYLLLFARGGIYSDMDTVPLQPLEKWPSVDEGKLKNLINDENLIKYQNFKKLLNKRNVDPGFIIGIEADPDRDDWSDWYARRIQFCQWTIQSKPGHPILRELILNITATTLNSVQNDKTYQKLIDLEHQNDYNVNFRHKRKNDKKYSHKDKKTVSNVDGTDIMNWTGPGIFSDIVFDYLNNLLHSNDNIAIHNSNLIPKQGSEEKDEGTTRKFSKIISDSMQNDNHIPWEFFSLMSDPVLVDDVMVLPITCFSPGVGQMGSKATDDEMAFVHHMFSGSWKKTADENAGH